MQHQFSPANATARGPARVTARSSMARALQSGIGLVAGLGALALLAHAGLAQGAEAAAKTDPMAEMGTSIGNLTVAADTVWVMVAAFLVFFMQAGFAYVEGGLTRAKNQNNILMKNLLDFSFGTISFFVVGFAFMFGDGNPFVGTSGFLMNGADNSPLTGDAYAGVYSSIAWAGVPLDAKFLFQLVFAATAATIVSGAMAERTKFSSYLMYSIIISAFIYPISGHWIWGGGWLAKLGFWDFAGSTVVHSVGAWIALVGAAMLGPRIGKYAADGTPRAIPGHSIPMAGLGVFILWLGWFGFNPGSTMSAVGSYELLAHIAVTTNAAAATGGIFAMLTIWFITKKPDTSMTLNGVLGGLVAITAPCAWVSTVGAIAIGAIAGVLVVVASLAIEKTKTDDPVGAVAVHGVCGAFGTLCVGLFTTAALGDATGAAGPKPGLFYGGGIDQLAVQAIGVGAVFAWCIVTGLILFSVIKAVNGLRVSAEEEVEGLDVHEHGGTAYPNFATSDTNTLGMKSAGLPASALRPQEVEIESTL